MNSKAKRLEKAIESNPIKAVKTLPEGSEIQKEAVEAAIGKGPEKEVNNKVVGDFLNTYKNPDVHLSETMEKENEEWRNNQLNNAQSSIITNDTPSELSPHDLDMLDPTDKTEIAGDIDDLTAEDNGVLNDIVNQDENAEVDETEKPIITEEELQSSAAEAPETIDTFDGLTDNNAAELEDTMSAIEELYKIHNSLPQPSGKVDSDAMLKEIAKHTKDAEEYQPGRYKAFILGLKSQEAPQVTSGPNISAETVNNNVAGVTENSVTNKSSSASSNSLPSMGSNSGSAVSGTSVSSSASDPNIIGGSNIKSSGTSQIAKEENAPEARSFGGFLKGNNDNVPMSNGISKIEEGGGDIKSKPMDLPSGGGHTATGTKVDVDAIADQIANQGKVELIFEGKSITDIEKIKEIVKNL